MSTHTFSRTATSNTNGAKHNAGVIGMGFIGEVHIRAIRASGNNAYAVSAVTIEEAKVAAENSNVPNAMTTEALMADQNIGNITLEDALKLFLLPKNLGVYKGEEIEINNGRFGPYIKFGSAFISLPKGENPTDVTLERAQELIDEKTLADAPIAVYKGEGVQKGVGRFGPFIKWNGVFINVSRKYNFDHLSQSDIEELIEDKLQKNIDKVLHDWKEEGIVVEKARWGRSVILKGKLKIELGKEIDATILSLAQVQEIIAKKTPAKKTAAKKAPAKKTLAKKAVTKKK